MLVFSSLVSSSPKVLAGSLYVSGQVTLSIVLSGLSAPKDSPRIPRTTNVVLLPTKCDLPPSTSIDPSYVVATVYTAITFASIFSVLYAKGFSSSSNSSQHPPNPEAPVPEARSSTTAIDGAPSNLTAGNQPPEPPPEPDSSSSVDKAPRGTPWAWILFLAALFAAGLAWAFMGRDSDSSTAFIIEALSTVEAFYLAATRYSSTFDSNLGPESPAMTLLLFCSAIRWSSFKPWAYRCSKLILLAIPSYSVCIMVDRVFRRLRTRQALSSWLERRILVSLFSLVVVASFSQFSWIFWVAYYSGHESHWFGTIKDIDLEDIRHLASYLLIPISLSRAEKLMIIGPTVIQAAVMSLWSVSLVFSYSRAFFRKPLLLGSLVGGCAVFITAFAILVPIAFALPLHLSRHPHIKPLLWQAWDCETACKAIYWNFDYFVLDYNYWKSEQIEALHALVLNGSTFCLEALGTLSWVQRLLVATPAVIYYGSFYILPNVPRLPAFIRNWRR